MKGMLFFHSNTGNTKLACEHLAGRLTPNSLGLEDISLVANPIQMDYFDFVGFATWTYFFGIPPLFQKFLDSLPVVNKKPAFLFSTFGMMPGSALRRIEKSLTARGYLVFAAHALRTPESYPPFIIRKGWDGADSPSTEELDLWKKFLNNLSDQIGGLADGNPPEKIRIATGIWDLLFRPYSIVKARKEMGGLLVDAALCNGCGLCREVCLYQAIRMNSIPAIDRGNCSACWACFHQCPQKAIHTEKIRGMGHYPGPNPILRSKLS